MANDDFEVIKNAGSSEGIEDTEDNSSYDYFDSDLLLLLIIIFIFFQKTDTFSEHFQLLNDNVRQIKDYLDTADATLQALDQASQIPNDKSN
ncbi:hypothetical protein JCM16358_08900 [Halanaerocella petrolearia]